MSKQDLFYHKTVIPDNIKQLICLSARIDDKAMPCAVTHIEIAVFLKIALNGYCQYHSFTYQKWQPSGPQCIPVSSLSEGASSFLALSSISLICSTLSAPEIAYTPFTRKYGTA